MAFLVMGDIFKFRSFQQSTAQAEVLGENIH